MLKNQKFGVEIEMTGITRAKAADLVAEILGSRPSGPSCGSYETREIKDAASRVWKVMRDSSINPKRNDVSNDDLDEYRV